MSKIELVQEAIEKLELELLKQFGFDEDFYNLLVKSNGEIEEKYEGCVS